MQRATVQVREPSWVRGWLGQASSLTTNPHGHHHYPSGPQPLPRMGASRLLVFPAGGWGALHWEGPFHSQVFLLHEEGGVTQLHLGVGTDRGSPLGLSSGVVPNHLVKPTPSRLLPQPPGSEPSGPQSSLAQQQPCRAHFNWGRWDVRTPGPYARAWGGHPLELPAAGPD